MVCANPRFIYCPRLQYWRSPTAKTDVCPHCQYLGCEHNLKYLVQVPAKHPNEDTIEAREGTLRAEDLPLQRPRPAKPTTVYHIAKKFYSVK